MIDRDGTARLMWPDVAKGTCLVLVVLWHVTRKDYLQLPWDTPLPVAGAWGAASEVLLPVRMPLFFLVSGLFARRVLDLPWRGVWVSRVAPLLYLFVLWTLIHNVVLRSTPGFDTAVAEGPLDLVVQLSVTPGNLWYLLALAAYVVVARGTRAHPRLALVGALLLSLVAYAGWVPTPGNRAGLSTNLAWFLLGSRVVQLPERVRLLLLPERRRVALWAAAAFALAAALWQLLDADAWAGVRPLLAVLGIAAGAGAARLVCDTRVGPALAWWGRRTLPVYVLHLPLVALAHLASSRLVGDGSGLSTSWVAVSAYPVVVTAAVLGGSLLLLRLLGAGGGWWLFAPPWRRPVPVAAGGS